MSIHSYAVDPADAAELANKVRQLLWDSRASHVGGVWVRWWNEVSGPTFYPEPSVDRARYQVTGELRLATN